jgi:integrase
MIINNSFERSINMPATKDERKNGTWRYQKQITDPNTGKKIIIKKRGFSSKREAEAAEALAFSKISNDVELPIILVKNMCEDYLEFKRKRTCSRSVQKKESIINRYIIPDIGLANMVTFSNMEARSFYDRLIESKNSNNHKNAILELTKAIFKHAETFFGLKVNPINRLEKFKVVKNNIYAIYSIDDVEQYMASISEDNDYEYSWKVFFNTLYFLGVRRGEAKGLKWNDIDFNHGTVRIDEQYIDKDPILGRTIAPLKSVSSNRTISADNESMLLFENLFRMRNSKSDFSIDEFVFKRKEDNMPFADNTIDHRNRVHSKLSGLKKIRIHDFRHSFASMNYDLGADMKTISEQMGHSNLTITQNVYTSIFQKKNDERIALVNQARSKKK